MAVNLKSKSIHLPREADDGIRVCVMRRIKESYDFDIWVPAVAPSNDLLDTKNSGEINWTEFVPRFEKEILSSAEKRPFIDMIENLAQNNVVTLLCHEETGENCHRDLLIEFIKRHA